MEKASGNTTAMLDEKLSNYWKLADKRESLQERLKKVETEKSTVSQRIYEKVKQEYQQQIEDVGEALRPLKGELETHRKEGEQQLDEVNHVLAELEDKVSEVEFRSRVGELDDHQVQEVMDHIAPRLDEARAQQSALHRQINAFDMRTAPSSSDDPGSTQRDGVSNNATGAVENTPHPADTSPEPATVPMDGAEGQGGGASLENPRNWAEDIAPAPETAAAEQTDTSPATATAVDTPQAAPKAAPRAEYDPLAALADPSPDRHSPSVDEGSLPNLVVKAGNNEGRVVPLLPMTMSVGREHDNNIEIKDPDVARYHARIVYENGRFSIEDLESSSGTHVNGERTAKTVLKPGDVIKVGSTVLLVEVS